MRDQFVRRDADRRAVRVDVAVQVDQARRHQLAGGIDRLECARRRDVRLDRLDETIADTDVAFAAQRLARVEHVAALDHEIEFVIRPHGGAGRAQAARRGERERTGSDKKIATRRGGHGNSLPCAM